MIILDKTIISDDIRDSFFCCDLDACKGACCVEGDAGAPLEELEISMIEDYLDLILPYLLLLRIIKKFGGNFRHGGIDHLLRLGVRPDAVDRLPVTGHALPVVMGENQGSSALLTDSVEDLGQVEFFQRANLGGDDAENHADVAALLEHVDAEAAQAGNAIGHIEFRVLLEFLLLPVGHHAEGHVQHVLAGIARILRERAKVAIHAVVRIVTNLQMQV